MALALVQAEEIASTAGNCAPLVSAITTTEGNLMVCFIGADLCAEPVLPDCPTFSVTDSASNLWIPVALTSASVQGARSMVWVCPNALPVTWVSVAPTGYVANMIAVTAEYSGLPSGYYPVIDTPGQGNTSSPSMTAEQADYCFTVWAGGSDSVSGLTVPSGWTALTGGPWVSGTTDAITLHGAWKTVSAGTVDAAWSASGSFDIAACVIGLSQASSPPVPPQASFPAVKVELAFGSTPGNQSDTVMYSAWTDVTSKAIGSGGQVSIQATRGRTYELSQPEAGTCTIGLDNWTGDFNPLNQSSPYYPDVVLGTPVRVTAFWEGRRYGIFQGYVTRWPQDWPDLPQFGLSRMQCTDTVGIASSITLASGTQQEILIDTPYASFPFGEQYSTTEQDTTFEGDPEIGSVQVAVDANGLPCYNAARTNQRQAVYQDGNPVTIDGSVTPQPVLTGLSLNMQGDAGTGMGSAAYSGTSSSFRGPGVLYADPAIPSAGQGATGNTVEFFILVDTWSGGDASQEMFLFNALPAPEIEYSGSLNFQQVVSVYISYAASVYTLNVVCAGKNQTPVVSMSMNYTAYMGMPAHVVVLLNSTSGQLYVNGIKESSLTGNALLQVAGLSWGEAHWPYQFSPHNGNYSMQYGSWYGYCLPAARIASHYNAGIQGFAGDVPIQRFGRYMAWSLANLNPGSWPMGAANQVSTGPAYDVDGTSLSQALNSLCQLDGGLWYSNRTGNTVFQCRRANFNLAPSVTFGDSGDEIPYEQGVGLDYDNTYLQNTAAVQQENGEQTLVNAVVSDLASQEAYFPRGPQSVTVQTTSAEDVFDQANWTLSKYSQPQMRLRALTVEAASKPAVFASLLAVDIGTAATVNRRPLGATGIYSFVVSIQQIQVSIGPGVFTFGFVGTPYVQDAAVLTTDGEQDVLGANCLAW